MKRVVLRGELARKFGRVHHFDLNTPAEAIRALCANFEGFQQTLLSAGERGVGYIVQVGRFGLQDVEATRIVRRQRGLSNNPQIDSNSQKAFFICSRGLMS